MSETLLCPRCPEVGLFVGEARSLHPAACGACGGVWLKPDEAARILRPLFTPGGLPGHASRLRCPDCSKDMTEWTVGTTGVELNSCPDHGTWFDRSEVEALATAAAKLRGAPEPDFSAVRASDVAPVAVAGAAAAIAVHAAAHADVLLAAQQLAPATTDTESAAAFAAPDAAFAAVELTATTVQLVGDAAVTSADIAADVALSAAGEGGVEAAGGLLEALLEFIGGLFG